jgi:DNA-binding response OmpR family regulator
MQLPTPSSPLVLVADDEPSMLELVARHLKTLDNPKLDVLEASDGEQAWALAREHLPDLVVLDVMMPGMSGWEVCRKIREDVALAHTSVVMLTGIGENLNEMTSPLYGADAYLDKPFEFGELDEKVKSALLVRAAQREGVTRPLTNGVSGPAKVAKVAAPKAAAKKAAPKKKAAAKKAAPKVKVAAKKKAAPKKKAAAKKVTPKKKAAPKKKVAAKNKPAKKQAKKTAPKKKTVAKKKSARR